MDGLGEDSDPHWVDIQSHLSAESFVFFPTLAAYYGLCQSNCGVDAASVDNVEFLWLGWGYMFFGDFQQDDADHTFGQILDVLLLHKFVDSGFLVNDDFGFKIQDVNFDLG